MNNDNENVIVFIFERLTPVITANTINIAFPFLIINEYTNTETGKPTGKLEIISVNYTPISLPDCAHYFFIGDIARRLKRCALARIRILILLCLF